MKRLLIRWTFLASLMVCWSAPSSEAATAFRSTLGPVSLSVMGAITRSLPSVSSNYINVFSPELGFGGGLLLGIPVSRRILVELGGLFVTRVYTDTQLGTAAIDELEFLEIPLQFRFRFSPAFSIGLGGYYALGIAQLNQKSGSVITRLNYSDYGIKPQDYGAMASLGLVLPLTRSVSFHTQFQYLLGINNLVPNGNGTSSFKYGDFQGLIGLKFWGR